MELILNKYPYEKVDKFIDEVFWRIYWRGWLELRPQVWKNYLKNLKKLKDEFKDNRKYIQVTEGNSNIECFNDWVKELKETNYLHNHTRMWFASIWIFTLNLPWQLGANFFMRHLFDGDSASNTLSWRWVAGLQTIGKHYLATASNISKFTNNVHKPQNLNENALWNPDEIFQRPPHAFNNFPVEDMVCGHVWEKIIDSNWKSFWENFNECLHCPNVHPELTQLVPMFTRRIINPQDLSGWVPKTKESDPKFSGGLKKGAQTWSEDGYAQGCQINSLSESDLLKGHVYASSWPSVFIGGYADHILSLIHI